MDLDTQIEQTRIALQILEGRKAGNEPEWEALTSFNNEPIWTPGKKEDDVLFVARNIPIRLKPACRVIEEKPDPYAELRAAHAAGKVIQVRKPKGIWIRALHPSWSELLEYRVQPEEPNQSIIKLGDWIQEPDGTGYLVLRTQGTSIFYDDDWVEVSDLSSAIQISHDCGATWNPINTTL